MTNVTDTQSSPSIQPLQVAIASSDGLHVDGHFGSCEQFYIYKIDAQNLEQIEVRTATEGRGVEKNAVRAQLIDDCHLMFCAAIGGPAAARVIRCGIHPLKSKNNPLIDEQLTQLQSRMQDKALPPWLAKITGLTKETFNA